MSSLHIIVISLVSGSKDFTLLMEAISHVLGKRETDADVPLDLQLVIDRCYHNGRYDDIDYNAEPIPPLEPDDAAWARELLSASGS